MYLCPQSVADASPPDTLPITPARRIAYYEQQLAVHPHNYPVLARLGMAWLEQARESYDPQAVVRAREALQQSLNIQPNFEALKGMAAVANFSHRFDDALAWCHRAQEALPEDMSLVAMQVEAYLALGRGEDAQAAIARLPTPPRDFYSCIIVANWHVLQGRQNEAVQQYQRAADLAARSQTRELAGWASVMAAGVMLDTGRLDEARQLLAVAAPYDPGSALLCEHQAELAEADGQPQQALAMYEQALQRQADPEWHRRARLLAGSLENAELARRHFSAAERLCRQAIEHGEVYSLQTLASLYCDAGVRLEKAIELAERNLQFKRDATARQTLARARELQAAAPTHADTLGSADRHRRPLIRRLLPWR